MTYGSILRWDASVGPCPPSKAPTLPPVHMVWLGYSVSVVRYLLKCGMWRLHLLRLFLSHLMFCSSLQRETIPPSWRASLQWGRNILKNEDKDRQVLFNVHTNYVEITFLHFKFQYIIIQKIWQSVFTCWSHKTVSQWVWRKQTCKWLKCIFSLSELLAGG